MRRQRKKHFTRALTKVFKEEELPLDLSMDEAADSVPEDLEDAKYLLSQIKSLNQNDSRMAVMILASIRWTGEYGYGSKLTFFNRARTLAALDLWTNLSPQQKDKMMGAKCSGIRQSPIFGRIKKKVKETKAELDKKLQTAQDMIKHGEMAAAQKIYEQIVLGANKQQQFAAAKEIMDRVAPKPTRDQAAAVAIQIPGHVMDDIAKALSTPEPKKLETEIIDVTPEENSVGSPRNS